MRLAAGEGAAFAIEREVTKPDVVKKAEPLQNFAPDFAADFFLLRGQIPILQPALRGVDREMTELGDIQTGSRRSANRHREHLRPQARPAAGLANDAALVLVEPVPGHLAFAFLEEPRELRDESLERLFRGDRLTLARGGETDFLLAGAMDERVLEGVVTFAIGARHGLVVSGRDGGELSFVELLQRGCAPSPGTDRHVLQLHRVIRNEELRIKDRFGAEAVADRAGALGAIERKMARRDFGVAVTGLGIEVLVAQRQFLADGVGRTEEDGDNARAGLERELE